MRYKVFVDTNILLSGIFFEGNESRILDLYEAVNDNDERHEKGTGGFGHFDNYFARS